MAHNERETSVFKVAAARTEERHAVDIVHDDDEGREATLAGHVGARPHLVSGPSGYLSGSDRRSPWASPHCKQDRFERCFAAATYQISI